MESAPRYFIPPADHFFLLGSRGTGKTWLMQRYFPQALRVDLLGPGTLRSLAARPERLRELIAARPEVRHVLIDEVQKLSELLEVAHLRSNEDLRGLKSFGEDFPESQRWLLYRGREKFVRDGILCMPCEEFLLQLKPNYFPLS